MIIKITNKAKDQIKISQFDSTKEPAVNRYCEWCVDIFNVAQKKYFIAINPYSMAGFCFPAKGLLDSSKFEIGFILSLKDFLKKAERPEIYGQFIEKDSSNMFFCKNTSTKIRSALNMKKHRALSVFQSGVSLEKVNEFCFNYITTIYSTEKNCFSTKELFLSDDMTKPGKIETDNMPEKKDLDKKIKAIKFELKMLGDLKPELKRTFLVSEDTKMSTLGYAIMTMIRAQGEHLFEFEITTTDFQNEYAFKMTERLKKENKIDRNDMFDMFALIEANYPSTLIEIPDPYEEYPDNRKKLDARKITIGNAFKDTNTRCRFTYDFGDSWEFSLTVLEKVETLKKLTKTKPVLILDAESYGIVEDCGGIPGLENLIQVFKTKKGRAYKQMSEWLGKKDFDFSECDVDLLNNIMPFTIKSFKANYE